MHDMIKRFYGQGGPQKFKPFTMAFLHIRIPSQLLRESSDTRKRSLAATWMNGRHLGDVLRPGLILDHGQLEPDHRTAFFAVWWKANPWGGATAGHTQIGLLAHITFGPPGIEQRILANFPFAHGPLAPPAA